jgi:hypothetical protein
MVRGGTCSKMMVSADFSPLPRRRQRERHFAKSPDPFNVRWVQGCGTTDCVVCLMIDGLAQMASVNLLRVMTMSTAIHDPAHLWTKSLGHATTSDPAQLQRAYLIQRHEMSSRRYECSVTQDRAPKRDIQQRSRSRLTCPTMVACHSRSQDKEDKGGCPAGSSAVRISTSDFSVRCTGHFSAIPMRRPRCSPLRSPSSVTTHSIRSIIPAFVSHSAQSVA